MRRFYLNRKEDISGVSGVGRVAEGIQFHDGQCVMSWFGQHHSIAVYPNIEDLECIHGHEGRTKVEWADDSEPDEGPVDWSEAEDYNMEVITNVDD